MQNIFFCTILNLYWSFHHGNLISFVKCNEEYDQTDTTRFDLPFLAIELNLSDLLYGF
jgi:hypothetical protein